MNMNFLKVLFKESAKKGQFNVLATAAIALVIFGVVVVVGTVITQTLGNNIGGTANTTAQYIATAFGSTGGGLASWTIIIVTVIVGSILIGLISGAFGRGRQ